MPPLRSPSLCKRNRAARLLGSSRAQEEPKEDGKQLHFTPMSAAIINLAYLLAVALFVLGLKGLSHPRAAVWQTIPPAQQASSSSGSAHPSRDRLTPAIGS
jgi:hypothetical protein